MPLLTSALTPNPQPTGRVRELREQAGLSQFDLARQAGVSVGTVQRYEAGLFPRRSTSILERLTTALGVSEDEIRGVAA